MELPRSYRYLTRAPIVFGVGKVVSAALASLPFVRAAPTYPSAFLFTKLEDSPKPEDPSLWIYLSVAALLVLLGGAFAGLTIALMGQDEIYLKVIKESGEGAEQKYAERVLRLLNKGKHWVLVTLLLSNVITNETLPIVLDRSLGGGWPAVLGSTVLIVIFGEIAPQSVCVRYGLPIGSWMAPFVLVLMYILAPVAWPTAKLLDWLLGKDHGTVYKKAGLKTLVSLHKSLGDKGQNLVDDEVTIIGAVLDLKDKTIGSIMTPMEDVFTMSLDDTLDEDTMDVLLSQGYSRIPIHHPDNDHNFVGMLLVKMLITYDPEDAKPVRDFALATLPESRADTSCLDIINFFQQGKSHMVLVSDHPGQDHGALGVVTLEDVIEELIGEEIVDESDVFIDVHKALRRTQLAPRTRVPKGAVVRPETPHATVQESDLVNISKGTSPLPPDLQKLKTMDAFPVKAKPQERTASPRQSSIPLRRRSSAADSKFQRYNTAEMREHLKHMAPSNQASRPNAVRSTTVVIKPGTNGPPGANPGAATPVRHISESRTAHIGGIGERVLSSGGKDASDGVQVLQAGYGSVNGSPLKSKSATSANKNTQADPDDSMDIHNYKAPNGLQQEDESSQLERPSRSYLASADGTRGRSSGSQGSQRRKDSRSPVYTPRGPARSGSITENIVDSNGIRKVVLEMTSSSSNDEGDRGASKRSEDSASAKKKRKRKRRKDEEEPLLGRG